MLNIYSFFGEKMPISTFKLSIKGRDRKRKKSWPPVVRNIFPEMKSLGLEKDDELVKNFNFFIK